MTTLYGTKGSGSAAVEAALEVIGLPFRQVEAASWQPSAGLDELRRVNPLAQIPTLVLDDGSVLNESAAILIDLGLAHPQSGLLATEPAPRAQQIRGLVYIAANCYAGIGILDYPDRWYPDPDDAVKAKMKERGRARLHELWDLFADQFPASPWLGGPRLGALDILAATVSRWSGTRQHLQASRPAFSELLARIDAEPRIAAVWARHWPKP
ncbi:MAG TPA: glutathione S-transferase family protein [Caldimonas sp.]|nr:glutathione S-transferase family protein [Caldimonas sp.]